MASSRAFITARAPAPRTLPRPGVRRPCRAAIRRVATALTPPPPPPPSSFIGKFAYGTGGAGFLTVELSGSAQAEFVALDDKTWNVKASAAAQCAGSVPSTLRVVPPETSPSGADGGFGVFVRERPYFYFFSLGSQYFTGAPECSAAITATTYTVTAKQFDGSQLSYEELGLPAVYGVFFAAAVVTLGVHVWGHYVPRESAPHAFAPLIVRALTATLALHALSTFFHLIEWGLVASAGKGLPFFAVTAALLRLLAQSATWVLAALAAVGHGISSSDANWRAHLDWRDWRTSRGVALLGALILTYLIVAIVYAAQSTAAASRTASGESPWAAAVLVGLTLGYAGWFFVRVRSTKAAEISLPKKALLDRLTLAVAAALFVLPVAELLSVTVPPYEALRVVVGTDLFLLTVVNGALAWVLWPARAAEGFRELAVADGGSSLDEAYNYSAALTGEPDGRAEFRVV